MDGSEPVAQPRDPVFDALGHVAGHVGSGLEHLTGHVGGEFDPVAELVEATGQQVATGFDHAAGEAQRTIDERAGAVGQLLCAVTDAVDAAGQRYSESRLLALLANEAGGADAVISRLRDDLQAGDDVEQFDDITVLALHRTA